MKIVKPYAKIVNPFGMHMPMTVFAQLVMRHVEYCARVSHRSEGATPDTTNFLRRVVLEHGDWSVVEHANVSVEFLVDRGVTHELVRHRLASYTQESTRFVRYFKEKDGDVLNPASFVYPYPDIDCSLCLDQVYRINRCGEGLWGHRLPGGTPVLCCYDQDWLSAISESEEKYKALLKKGWRPQEARSVFPNALASKVVATMNLRTWRHVFMMRTTKEAHPQFRQVTEPLLAEFKQMFAPLYDDLEPGRSQAVSIARQR